MLLNFVSEFSILISTIGYLATYILTGIAYYRVAKKRGIPHPGIAWIPIVQIYTVGKVADDISAQYKEKTHRAPLLLIFSALTYVLSGVAAMTAIPVLSDIVSSIDMTNVDTNVIINTFAQADTNELIIACIIGLFAAAASVVSLVLQFLSWYALYREYAPQSAGIYLLVVLLGAFLLSITFLAPIFVLIIAKNTPQFEVLNSTSSYQNPPLNRS